MEVLLACVIAVQAFHVAAGALRLAREVRSYRGLSAVERSARIAFGDSFWGFVSFIRARVPSDARLVVPAMDVSAVYGNLSLMLHYLYPLDIRNCPNGPDMPDCVRSLVGERTYILHVGEFPPVDAVPPSKGYLPYSNDMGLYVPVSP